MVLKDEVIKDKLENFRKSYIIISMFVVGILLLLYKLRAEYYQDNFGSYTSMVVGITSLLAIIGLILLFIDVRKFMIYELLGFIFLIIASAVLMIYPSSPALDFGVESTGVVVVGIILAIIAGVILARYGGYFSPCVIGLSFQIIFAGYYPMMSPDATSFHANAFMVSNMGIGFLIMSFILLIYQDLKFYFLANMIKQANRLRKEKKYSDALRYCDKALFIYPNFVTALNNKGNILFNLKQPNEAIEYYNKAIKINPNYKQAQSNLQVVQRKSGRASGL
ncbi:MAG: tetratricopeptide repeat protein [Thermoplasmata archaeon]|nr:MAG: tetratricopeptide repeat protein [Thermoplasmata archaeon]